MKKYNYCIDCGKSIKLTSKRCRNCYILIQKPNLGKKHPIHSERMKGKNNPNWKGGNPYCIDCGKQLKSHKSKRCPSCSVKSSSKYRSKKLKYKIIKIKKERKPRNPKTNFCIDCGNPILPQSKRCIKCFQKGSLGSNWKGGITSLQEQIRHSIKYDIWRLGVFIRDNFTCQKCRIKKVYIEVHHIKPFHQIIKENNYKELWDINNGITLCKKCHIK